jgi:hypothetical protein
MARKRRYRNKRGHEVVNDTACADANTQGKEAIDIRGSLDSVGK